MEKIDKTVFEEILVKNCLDLTLQNVAGEKISVEQILSLVVEDGNYEFKRTGYTVKGDREGKVESLDELYSLLNKIGAGDGEFILDNINGQFASVTEMRDKIAFDKISMDGLLERYKEADSFSLTTDYGDVHIDERIAQTALKELSEEQYKLAESQYLLIPEGERKSLPAFDKLFKEISDTCNAHRKKHKKRIKETGGNSFFCDEHYKGKYKNYLQVWHIYSAVDFIQACDYDLNRLKGLKEVAPIDRQLKNLPVLKEALISAKPTYVTHCTISGSLATVFKFKLNEKTKAWLKTHKDDYDFNTGGADYRLDDLALYHGDELLFSSCTHEGFHNDAQKG